LVKIVLEYRFGRYLRLSFAEKVSAAMRASLRHSPGSSFKFRLLIAILFLFLITNEQIFAQPNFVTGIVFRDFNASGVRDAAEPGAGGITITAYNAAGTVVGTTTSFATQCLGAGAPIAACTGVGVPALGSYSLGILAETAVRVEFTGVPAGSQPGAFGTGSGTSVQFVAAGGTANFGINRPGDFCGAVPGDIRLATTCVVNGDPATAGVTLGSLVTVPYTAGNNAAELIQGNNVQTGSIWGVAYQRTTETLFAAANLKRHIGLSSAGLGGIFRSDTNGTSNATLLVDVESFFSLDLGTVGSNAARGLGAAADPSYDETVFGLIGEVGMGDLDIGDDDTTLYFSNLFDRNIYSFQVTTAATPTAVAGSLVNLGQPTVACTGGVARPWGLGIRDGLLYAGYVCTGESGGTQANLTANIFTRPATGAGAWSSLISFPLDYPKGDVYTGPAYPSGPRAGQIVDVWETWSDNFATFYGYSEGNGPFQPVVRPQPILSDIDFDTDGSLIIGFVDRAGHQLGHRNLPPTPATPNIPRNLLTGISGGDVLRVCNINGTLQLENGGTCPGRTASAANLNSQGPGGGEYFFGENIFGDHDEISYGGVAVFPGTNEVILTAMDPERFDSGGFIALDAGTGGKIRDVELYFDAGVGAPTSGKANGIGDISLMCQAAPIEIGNRIWNDVNRNGIQDPGEAPIAGVRVELRTNVGGLIRFVTTDANGNYYFSNGPGTSSGSAEYGITQLATNTNYQVVIPLTQTALVGYTLTEANDITPSPGGSDLSDSDFTTSGSNAVIPFTTGAVGANNHTFDAGFYAIDRGDLPDTAAGVGAGNYETLLANGGASHVIVTGLRMGATVDAETDGQPNAAANGDDTTGSPDDEDGVTVADLTLTQGSPANVRVTATNTTGNAATLYGFIDFNGDGDFADTNETATIAVPTGSNNVEFTLAFGTVPFGSAANTYARFRLSTQMGLTANGIANDGEVEDYPVIINASFDRGDLPDTGAGVGANNYETLLASGGASHQIVAGLLMGATVDAEANGQPNAAANSDDTTGSPDDEDGVTVGDLSLTQGSPANVRVTATNTTGNAATLYGFIDFNGDGDFADTNETATIAVPTGSNNVEFTLAFGTVPAGSAANTYARFRLSNQASLTANGDSTSGEVEDYPVVIVPISDRGDLPDTAAGVGAGNYETLLANGGASHVIVTNFRMGATVDGEANGQPNAAANGDDTTGSPDDEDGVTVADLTLTQGAPANVRVRATTPAGTAATLYGFIDFNGDGDFDDTNETATVAVPAGSSNVEFTLAFGTVPIGSAPASYARFRLSSQANLIATGNASDGEVEDYPITTLPAADRGDLPDTGAGVSAGNYETLLANGGASHVIVTGLRMGATVDAETDGQPNTAANGDDTTGNPDDEDGVTVADLTLTQGSPANVRVTATNTTGSPATLYGFIDFNGDGDFADTNETATIAVPTGSNNVEFTLAFGTVPTGSIANTYARFRLSNQAGLTATGNATSGEVEDYPVVINVLTDRGDLPDTGAGTDIDNYETLVASGGASHTIVAGLLMGTSVDGETNGQPNAAANGDDTTGSPDDEDGVTVADLTLTQGSPANVRVRATNTTGSPATLYGFIDFNGDGDFLDANETASIAVPTGSSNVEFTLPFGTVPLGSDASTYARFRLSNQAGLTANGASTSGEVEDYPVIINPVSDRGDLPDTGAGVGAGNYETLILNGAPSHVILPGLRMGAFVDGEPNGQPNAAANGDDTTGSPDDEDGVTIADLTITQGTAANVRVRATNTTGSPATLYGFIDFNGDGDFDDTNETATIAVPTGSNNVEFTLPFGTAPLGGATATYARFRLSNETGLTANGASASGEVEDYPVTTIPASDRGDLPDTGAGVGANNYETLLASGGASHTIVAGLRMGANVDSEANGQPNAAADGDDTNQSPDDEDGVTVADLTLTQGSPANVRVRATNTTGSAATLYGFIDFNGDGDFSDSSETATIAVPTGSNDVEFTLAFGNVPIGSVVSSYARFRLSNQAGLTANGNSTSGEVEDYPITTTPTFDRGDLPDTGAGVSAGNYETLLANGGASHAIISGLLMGATVDSEADGQPNVAASSDDTTGSLDDEDGVTVADLTLTQGAPANMRVRVTNTTAQSATLYGFMDFNGDGDFGDANETATLIVPVGTNNAEVTLAFGNVPFGSATNTYARFRLSNQASLTANGASTSGEVEDYPVVIAPVVDRGDLPDTAAGIGAGNYETLDANGGPSHTIVGGLRLGTNIDGESNGFPSAAANGDDTNQTPDDEDGVTVADLALTQGGPANVRVRATNTTGNAATLYGFIDFNGDGDFTDPGESVTVAVPSGSNNVQFTLPFGTVPAGSAASTYARFRLSTQGGLTANGAAPDGEIEDYPVTITGSTFDRGDLPDTAAGVGVGNYETLLANGGPSHQIVPGIRMGTTVDAEANGQPNAAANGDDTTGSPDDEDGVTVADLTLTQGNPANVRVRATNTTGSAATLYGFIDFNGDGDFGDTSETTTVSVPNGSNNVEFTLAFGNVPAGSAANSYARFRLSTQTGLIATGNASDGEIEDYPVIVNAAVDRGDLPDTAPGVSAGNYETIDGNGGPSHPIVAGLRMGATVDGEANGQPNAAANGDDTTGTPDDENGVTVADLTLTQGSPASVRVSVTNTTGGAATLFGFIDFNGDGDFTDPGETTSVAIPDGSNNTTVTLAFGNVPAGSAAASYARFRLSTDPTLGPTGAATNGEVEDYPVTINAASVDRGDLPDTGAGVGAGNYETTTATSGPSHPIVPGLRLGTNIDGEGDGQPNGTATGDDSVGTPDDEDGIIIADLSLVQGSPANVRTTVTNTTGSAATLFGFIDFNGDGDFTDPGETTSVAVPNGSTNAAVTLAFGNVPADSAPATFARFRLSTDASLTASGAATNGEVEDYPVAISGGGVDRGDLPDTTAGLGAGDYQTLDVNTGPSHPIVAGLRMGATVDGEADGQPNTVANGDDTTGTPDDEDGVTIADLSLTTGALANVRVRATNTTGTAATLYGFIDFNGDGDFSDPGEAATIAVPTGSSDVEFTLPFGSVPAGSAANTYARFRLSTQTGLTATDAATDGEVEDYPVSITSGTLSLGNRVWNDGDNSGTLNGEPGIDGVTVELYRDSNSDGVPDGPAIRTTTTAGGGYYLFDTLPPGTYLVGIPASNFQGAAPLVNFRSSTGAGQEPNPESSGDSNDNGLDATNPAASGILSAPVILSAGGEPINETDNGGAGSGSATNPDSNLTVDFGFFQPPPGTLSLGNRVWIDSDNSGTINGSEVGRPGVRLSLYEDADRNGVPDGAPIASTTTDGSGYYLFVGLQPGEYVVGVDAANFQAGGALPGSTSSTGPGQEADPEAEGDSNDNGIDNADPAANGILSGTVILSLGAEPQSEIDLGSGDGGVGNANSNLTVDFGFSTPLAQPPPPAGQPGPRVADPAIVKLVDPAFAQPGENVTFIITVTNPNAIPLDSVIFTDIVPNQFTVLGATASAGTVTVNGQTVSYFFQTMPPLSSFEVRINTRVRLDVVPPLTVDNVAMLGGIYSGQARATVTIGIGTGDALELPATGETPWWRTPALLSGLTLLLVAGYALLRKRRRTPSIAQE
jgi:uncharacterized repeat protein (TIGR01451 family)